MIAGVYSSLFACSSIHNGISEGVPPPYPLLAKADMPGIPVEYRYPGNDTWQPLFRFNPATQRPEGGIFMQFPTDRTVELRTT